MLPSSKVRDPGPPPAGGRLALAAVRVSGLVQDGGENVDADGGTFAGELDWAGGDCARAATDVQDPICLFDER